VTGRIALDRSPDTLRELVGELSEAVQALSGPMSRDDGPRIGARMRLVATIEQRAVIERILRHLGLPSQLPSPWPARAPPLEPDAITAHTRCTLNRCTQLHAGREA
jgi:hypothetical protein